MTDAAPLSIHDAFVGTAVAYQILQQPSSTLMEWLQDQERRIQIENRDMTDEEIEEGHKKITSSVALRAQETLEKHSGRDLTTEEKLLINDAAEVVLEVIGILDTDPRAFNPDQ